MTVIIAEVLLNPTPKEENFIEVDPPPLILTSSGCSGFVIRNYLSADLKSAVRKVEISNLDQRPTRYKKTNAQKTISSTPQQLVLPFAF
jgi:hypothetical protein